MSGWAGFWIGLGIVLAGVDLANAITQCWGKPPSPPPAGGA